MALANSVAKDSMAMANAMDKTKATDFKTFFVSFDPKPFFIF